MQPTADPASEKVPLVTKLAFGSGDVGPAQATVVNRPWRREHMQSDPIICKAHGSPSVTVHGIISRGLVELMTF